MARNLSLKAILISPFILVIKIYQLFISPLTPATCRYTPTCSHYAKEALETHGLIKGGNKKLVDFNYQNKWGY
jgi:hypothetical protein